jgi:hypothetical protein
MHNGIGHSNKCEQDHACFPHRWLLEQDAEFIKPGISRLASMIIEMAVEELYVSRLRKRDSGAPGIVRSSLMYLVDDSSKIMGDLALFEKAIQTGDRLNLIRLLLSWNTQQQVDLNELQGRYWSISQNYVQACFA